MIVGIDGSNVRAGGGLTHLRELLAAATPERFGIERVVVWAGRGSLERLEPRPWLDLRHEVALDGPLPSRLLWQSRRLDTLAARCDVLLAPGGLTFTNYRPRVVVSQNMLPFQREERARYGIASGRLRFELLTLGQTRSFEGADGIIFLSDFARRVVTSRLRSPPRRSVVVPHGVDDRFRRPTPATSGAVRKLLYVSTVSPYKHQWNVVEAVGMLRREGVSLELDLVGGSDHPASVDRLNLALRRWDPTGAAMKYWGMLPFERLHDAYHDADAFVFASSCENLPNILLEAMASALPIASSARGPMPEVLRDGGVYFDPEVPASIADAIELLVRDEKLRTSIATRAAEYAGLYSWSHCADATFRFVAEIAHTSKA